MEIFKRSKLEVIKGVIYAPCAALVVMTIAGFFTDNGTALCGLAAAVCAAMLYIALISSNIYFELSPNGRLRYFKGGTLRQSFDITRCGVSYRRESVGGFLASHTLRLKILPEGADAETEIDCDALGLNRFMEMYGLLDGMSLNKPEKLTAGTGKKSAGGVE